METKKYEAFLGEYYKKVTKIIDEGYHKKLSFAHENSDLNKLNTSIAEIVKKEYELNIDTSDFISKEFKDKKLRIVIRHAEICDEVGNVVNLEYSKGDLEVLKNLAEQKENEIKALVEFVEEVKMLLCTISCEREFKELLKAKGILNESGDVLYGSYLRTKHF